MKIQIFRNLWVLQIVFLLLAPLGLQAQKKEISSVPAVNINAAANPKKIFFI